MTTVTVSAVTHHDIDALVTSVAALFNEDAGRHDTAVKLDWPAREGAGYYSSLAGGTRPACSCWLAMVTALSGTWSAS
jgi:hypothetical protein